MSSGSPPAAGSGAPRRHAPSLPQLRQPGPCWARRPRPARGGGGRRHALGSGSSTQAAGISGPTAQHSTPLWRRREQLRPERSSRGRARQQRGCVATARSFVSWWGRGKLTDLSANRSGSNACRTRKSPYPLREWHVPNASSPPSPTLGARRGLPARFPASRPRRAPPIGGAHVGGRGLCADARAQAFAASRWLLQLQYLYGIGRCGRLQ